jgi:hypothetical protein
MVFRVARLFHIQKIAEIVEMPLRPGALGERVPFPLGDEGFRGHGRDRAGRKQAL